MCAAARPNNARRVPDDLHMGGRPGTRRIPKTWTGPKDVGIKVAHVALETFSFANKTLRFGAVEKPSPVSHPRTAQPHYEDDRPKAAGTKPPKNERSSKCCKAVVQLSMRLTLTVLWLLACLTIYCNSAVLSLPPSLIANAAAAFSRQQTRPVDTTATVTVTAVAPDATSSHTLRKKDTQFLLEPRQVVAAERAAGIFDGIRRPQTSHGHSSWASSGNNNREFVRPATSASASAVAAAVAAKDAHHQQQQQQQQQLELDLNRRKLAAAAAGAAQYDLSPLLAAGSATNNERANVLQQRLQQQQQQQQHSSGKLLPPEIAARIRADDSSRGEPLKYWPRQCQGDGDAVLDANGDCPVEYYRALFAGSRNRNSAAAAKHLDRFATAAGGGYLKENLGIDLTAGIEGNADSIANGDDASKIDYILMLLNGEKELIKFLHWAMKQLYPYQKFANNPESGAADYYHPSMYLWKKLNLSGRLEPPLLVEEPHYVIVRREQLQNDLQTGSLYRDDPFIPPRGRKHILPNLESLLHRSDPFMPNRGRRDKIKDIFKYDDLFFPNRGKKQKPPTAATAATMQVTSTATIATPRNASKFANDCCSIATSYDDNDDNGDEDNEGAVVGADEAANAFDAAIAAPPYDVAASRVSDKLKMLRMRLGMMSTAEKMCVQQHGYGDCVDAGGAVAVADGKENSQTNEIHNDNDIDNNNNSNKWLQGMPAFKMNDYDQSVKAAMSAAAARAAASGDLPSPRATKSAQHQEENRQLMNARQRRVAGSIGGDADAAGLAANRFQSTRSMSALAQQHRQRQLQQQQHPSQSQQQRRPQRRLSTRQYDANRQQLLERQPQQPLPQQQDRGEQARQRQQVKLLANLDVEPLLWRQLQLLPQQQEQQQQQQQQQHLHLYDQLQPASEPLETELATTEDDIDYTYFNDSN